MKTVIFDSPFQTSVAIPAIGRAFERGEEVVLTDEDAEVALQNPHMRLATDKETPSQRAQREAAEAAEKAVQPEPGDTTSASAAIVTPPPPKPDLTSQTVQPSAVSTS